MEPSSPFLKILPYEVARGWVEGLNCQKDVWKLMNKDWSKVNS